MTTTGKPGESAVYGFALRGGRESSTYAALNFSDVGLLRSSNTVFTGVPVGRSDLLSNESFSPEIALVNFGTQPAEVKVLYATMNESGPAQKTVAAVISAEFKRDHTRAIFGRQREIRELVSCSIQRSRRINHCQSNSRK